MNRVIVRRSAAFEEQDEPVLDDQELHPDDAVGGGELLGVGFPMREDGQ